MYQIFYLYAPSKMFFYKKISIKLGFHYSHANKK